MGTEHPATRFVAPSAIQSGVSLAQVLDRPAIELLAESLAAISTDFDSRRFIKQSMRGLSTLGLMQRAAHIAEAMAEELPTDFQSSARILIASFGPELVATESNGLAPFFYLPHSHFIAAHGMGCFESAMIACYEITKRFSAEFCVRRFLVERQSDTLAKLATWTSDANPHVRRLVSEGTRPRLPWGIRLKSFQDDPRPTIPLLEKLKDDPVPYVHRSVANHLADILKDNTELGFELCERWVDETNRSKASVAKFATRRWVVRHALRFPAKKGVARAVALRELAKR